MIFTRETTRLFVTLASGALLAACETTPAIQGANPDEIGQSLGYSRVIAVENVPDPATFTLEPVNSSTVVMGGRFGVRYLISFAHNCPEAGFGNLFDTTGTGGQIDAEDSIIIDEETYCRISEIHILEE